ncbi:MAG: sterol desaturase family protein [Sphingomonas sp.]|nr:sterol desaturase family protein [Sphingomonas sp.]
MDGSAPARRRRRNQLAATAALAAGAAGLFLLEKRRPLRAKTQPEPQRTVRNLTLGAMSMAVVGVLENPVVEPIAASVGRRRQGMIQMLPVPAFARDLIALALMDYTIYLWHVATHRVPFLWRFHLVHHLDLDLDSTTAMRFHFGEMAVSVPYRAAQVLMIGTSARALRWWQRFFFLCVVFHHSNLRLPARIERALAWAITTPRMHGIHHSAVQDETNSNWSSGLSIWDRLHGTFRLDIPQSRIRIGVPAYRRRSEIRLWRSLTLPFRRHRDAWRAAA